MGKAHIVPSKSIGVPKLELTAAISVAKLSASIVHKLNFDFSYVMFRIDSTVVLRYINNTFT